MSNVKDEIIKTLFNKAFQAHPFGSKDKAWSSLRYHASRKAENGEKIGDEFIIKKYLQYVDLCKKQQTELKYIKYLEHFIEDGMYWGEYEYSDKHQTTVERWLKGILKLLLSLL